MREKPESKIERRVFLSTVCAGVAVTGLFSTGAKAGVRPEMYLDRQSHWRWCKKCQGLYFAGHTTQGRCPAGGTHTRVGSGNYSLVQNEPSDPGQKDWRWCHKCEGLFFAGHATQGICPTGGAHEHTGSGNYSLVQNSPTGSGQQDWRWCPACEGLYFAGNSPSRGVCPGGGEHGGSGNYRLMQV